MTDAQAVLKEMQARKARNLEFFKRYFPQTYNEFKDQTLASAKLNIDPNSGEIELLEDDVALYGGDMTNYCQHEAGVFSEAFAEGKHNLPLRHAYVGEFHSGRFFHGSLERFLADCDATKGSARPYRFEYVMPQVAFLGCGLGQHIVELLKLRRVRHAVVVEHSPNRFFASLYVTDWAAIIQPFIDDQDSSFSFSVGNTETLEYADRVHAAYSSVWNKIALNVPFMPLQTFFYVHKADPFYTDVATRLNDEIEPYINTWGYYDDEVNQLNHVTHNLLAKIPVVSQLDVSNEAITTMVCGNGPSLNDVIDVIKAERNKLFVIAAGSTMHTLLSHGITPDLGVTVESDLATYEALTMLPETAKEIPLIAAAQVHPKTFELFGQSAIYFKSEATYSAVFSAGKDAIPQGTPSAFNVALAVALWYKMPNVFMTGCDFGFKDPRQSHAEGAFYYEDNERAEQFEAFKAQIAKSAYFLEENEHGKIYTTPFYNTCNTHAARTLKLFNRKDVCNLATGATVAGAPFGNVSTLTTTLNNQKAGDPQAITQKLFAAAQPQRKKQVRNALAEMKQILREIATQALAIVERIEPNMESIEIGLFHLGKMAGNSPKVNGRRVSIMRGTLWHWSYNFYALCKKVDTDDEKLEQIVRLWKQHYGHFLSNLPEHFNEFLSDTENENDPRLALTISESEPNIEAWLLAAQREPIS